MISSENPNPLHQAVLEIESFRYYAQNPVIFGDGNLDPKIVPIPGTALARTKIKEAMDSYKISYKIGSESDWVREDKMVFVSELNSSYADLLSSFSTSLETKSFAVGPKYRGYVEKLAAAKAIGPYILRVVKELQEEDPDTLSFIAKNLDLLADFDIAYWEFKEGMLDYKQCQGCNPDCDLRPERRKTAFRSRRILKSYQQFADGILDNVLKKDADTHLKPAISRFARFLAEPILEVALDKNFDLDLLPDSYNPARYWKRITEFLSLVGEDNHEKIAHYLYQSAYMMAASNQRLINFFDRELRHGQAKPVLAVAEFCQLLSFIHSPWPEGKEPTLHQEEVNMFWIGQFQKGLITADELLQIPVKKGLVYQALAKIPKTSLWQFISGDGREGPDSPLRLNQLLTSDDFCKDGDFIIKLISSGVGIGQKTIEAFRPQKETLDQIVEFGRSLFFVEEFKYPALEVINYWVRMFLQKQVNLEDLSQVAANIKKLLFGELKFGANMKFTATEVEKVKSRMESIFRDINFPDFLVNNTESVLALMSKQIFPTLALVNFISHNPQDGMQKLEDLDVQTKAGKFDPKNEIQQDLEFVKYLQLVADLYLGTKLPHHFQEIYESFKGLEYKDEALATLTSQETLEAEAAAWEAAKLYWFIHERAMDHRRDVLVVGNQRYGDFFVTSPLRPYLEDLGARVDFYYAHSGGASEQITTDLFPPSFIKELIDVKCDVIIVDGSPTSFTGDGTPRFPKAMNQYLNWFYAWNQAAGQEISDHQIKLAKMESYQQLLSKISQFSPTQAFRISHWLPNALGVTQVVVGNLKMEYVQPGNYQSPEIILANPVTLPNKDPNFPVWLKQHKPGFFDDPEKFTKSEEKIVFTPRGIEIVYSGRTKEEVVELVQEHIGRVLPRMMKLTNPLGIADY